MVNYGSLLFPTRDGASARYYEVIDNQRGHGERQHDFLGCFRRDEIGCDKAGHYRRRYDFGAPLPERSKAVLVHAASKVRITIRE